MRGRGETTRILLNYRGTKYENIKVSVEQWPAMKRTMPMRQMPVLEEDGKQLCQSTAINRYLARECGLTAKNSWDMAREDMIVEGIFDMWGQLEVVYMPILRGDKKTADEKWAQMADTTLKSFLDINTRFLNENGGQWFVGDSLTWADIAIAEFVSVVEDCFCQYFGGLFLSADNFPQLKAFKDKIFSLPKLKEYVSQRPVTLL